VYDRNLNLLYLYNDAATAYVGSCTPGVGSLTNSQGTLNCGSTTVAGSGSDLTVNWNITPKVAFTSGTAKNLYLYARDTSSATVGYTDKGDWTISGPAAPTLGAVTPAVRNSATDVAQNLNVVYSDANGYTDLLRVYLRINQTTSGVNGIFVVYDRNLNLLYLYNDAATAYVGSCTPGVGSLTNSQGTLNCGATNVAGSGSNLTVNWNITPKGAFAGATAKNLYLYARDNSGATVGYTDKGDWTVLAPAATPTLGTVTPSIVTSPPDVAQTFSTVYSDASGYEDLLRVYLKVSQTTSAVNSIFLVYDRKLNLLYLYNDAATAYLGSCTPGAVGTLTNNQGTLDCGATTVAGAGNNLTLTWSIIPKSGFVSMTPKNLYLYARDNSNATVGYTDKGNWIIGVPAAPTLGSVTPSVSTSAQDVAQGFTTVYSDANGYADLLRVYLKVSQTTNPVNSIFLVYDRNVNQLYLYNNAATVYVGGCTPGVVGTLTNGQGTLDCGATTVTGVGNDLTIDWSVIPKSTFVSTTPKNLYLYARDNQNTTAGYTDMGDWTITTP
jgi:hypothetical protein